MKEYKWQDNVKQYLIEAGHILIRRTEDITKDLNDELVDRIYITIDISCDDKPTLNIEKEYIPIKNAIEKE